MSLPYLSSKWTQHAVRGRSTPGPPGCCGPATLPDHQRPRDPSGGEPGQTARIELDLCGFCFSFLNGLPHFLPQVDDADSRCSIGGVTVDSTETEGSVTDAVDPEDLPLIPDAPPLHLEDSHPPPEPCSSPLSPPDRALARLTRSASSEPNSQRESPPMDVCDLR